MATDAPTTVPDIAPATALTTAPTDPPTDVPTTTPAHRLADHRFGAGMGEREEVIDFNGHFSARLPDGRGLLINAADSVRSRSAPADFIPVGFDGAVTVAASVLDAFVQAIYLEENALRQHLALQIGTPEPLSADECAVIGRNLSRPALLQKAWNYFEAKHFPAEHLPVGAE